jgi:hypothetical protein
MNWYFFSAAIIAFVVGLFHTILGEVLVFRKMRRESFIPTYGGNILKESNVRILWSTWHALTIFGWGMAFLLFWLSWHTSGSYSYSLLENAIAASMLGGSVLVLIGTKGMHPGWFGLLSVAILIWIGS